MAAPAFSCCPVRSTQVHSRSQLGQEDYRKAPTRLRFYEVIERDQKVYLLVNKRATEAQGSDATASAA
jgi:hypothetical protein